MLKVIRSILNAKDLIKRAKRAVNFLNKVRQGKTSDNLARDTNRMWTV